jgi:hypothetical protein
LSGHRRVTDGILVGAEHMMQHVYIAFRVSSSSGRVRQDVRVEVPCPPDPVEGGPDRHGVGEVVPGPPSSDLRNAIDTPSQAAM